MMQITFIREVNISIENNQESRTYWRLGEKLQNLITSRQVVFGSIHLETISEIV